MKSYLQSANSLLLMAFGLSNFFVNLFVPHAIIKYLKARINTKVNKFGQEGKMHFAKT